MALFSGFSIYPLSHRIEQRLSQELDTVSQKVSDSASKNLQGIFGWSENPAVQKLLDVVVAIIAEEYVQTVRKNPETFREIASAPAGSRNDEMGVACNDGVKP